MLLSSTCIIDDDGETLFNLFVLPAYIESIMATEPRRIESLKKLSRSFCVLGLNWMKLFFNRNSSMSNRGSDLYSLPLKYKETADIAFLLATPTSKLLSYLTFNAFDAFDLFPVILSRGLAILCYGA